MYLTGPFNSAWALDARTGRPFWRYQRELPNDLTYGAISPVNRGFGILGDRLFMVTPDAHVVSLDAKTGAVLWDTTMADYKIGYAATAAPLVIKDKVIVGISGGDFPTRGFLDAYDPATGARLWRFYTVPGRGRTRQRHVAELRVDGARGRRHVGDRQLRSRPQPALLGHRQPQPAVLRRRSPGQQSLHRVDHGARRRHRHAEVVSPVHAARHPRLGFEPRAGAGRSCRSAASRARS